MSILSTSSKLVKVGGIEYSAGSGISIDDYVISVSGEFGKTYSAGDNIGIYEQDNQLYISGKDWTDDINAASANAYAQATAMIPPEFDPSFISGSIDSISGELDNKLNSSSFNTWLDGQYTSDISHIEGEINYISGVTTAAQQNLDYLSGQIDNKLDTDTFTAWSASQAENDYELSAGSGISLYNDDVNKLTRIDVTGTFGNPEVENYVQTNSGTISEVNNAVETYSASWNEVSSISGNFMATYGSTTLNQISNAIGSGLDVYCRYNDGHGRILSAPLASNGYGAYTFTTTYNDNVYYFVIQPDGGDGAWSISSKSILTAQIQSDWNQTLSGNPDYIKNKPDLEEYAKTSALNDYVPFSAEELPIGDSNTATNTGFAQGNSNSADNASLAQGYYNSASTYSLAQGGRNYAYQDSFAQGIDNSATQYSLAQGKSNSAYNYGIAIGSANSAFNYSQAFGRATIATASGMAIGTYNKTEDAAFVIGDGESEYLKSDSFVVYRDGSVSAKGKISAAGEELGGGTTYTGDAQGALDEVYTNSGVWLTGLPIDITAKNVSAGGHVRASGSDRYRFGNFDWAGMYFSNGTSRPYNIGIDSTGSNFYIATAQNKYERIYASSIQTWNNYSADINYISAAITGLTGYVPQSAFDELKQSYDALSSLFATYSGQWLLPNEGV